MVERMLVQGNEAVGWGALNAGCDGFFGYPITPQNEIPEWFAREFPKRGKVFVQSQSELGSINMLYGGAAAGFRVMTSTSSPGWGLMQEGMSHIVAAELPCVVVLVQRGGPGAGSVRHAQMDYLSATRGGGQGGYKNIVLAPASVQEVHDLVQLAFYLADKYCNPVVVLSDGIMGLIGESLEMKTLDFGPLPEKNWAMRGRERQKDGIARMLHSAPGVAPSRGYMTYLAWLVHMDEKYRKMADSEVRYEMYQPEDAKLLVVAYGYPSRVSKEASKMARAQGLKVGLVRPITLWPFPSQVIRDKAEQGCRFLVVEDSLGQMVDDVRMAVQGRVDVALLGVQARHLPTDGGMILPGRVLEEIRRFL
jgi:2-oxoglutarate ferredoxin oxidoreductase subunit alpha